MDRAVPSKGERGTAIAIFKGFGVKALRYSPALSTHVRTQLKGKGAMKLRDAGRAFLALIVAGLAVFAICAAWRGGTVSAQQVAEKEAFGGIFVKTDAMIPMRDAVKLHTEIGGTQYPQHRRCSSRARRNGTADDDAGLSHVCWDFIARCLRTDISS